MELGPGRRVPRTVDGAELAIRAVLGQQVSTRGARALAARMVLHAGAPLPVADGRVTHLFPEPAALLEAQDSWPGMPLQRRAALIALLEALADGRLRLDPGADWMEARAALAGLGGVGPWTIATIAMRALGDPDAFPATDLGVRAAGARLGLAPGIALARHAERWRPWRAYATQYLVGYRGPSDQPTRGGSAVSSYLTMDSPIGPLTLVADDGALTVVGMDAPVPDRAWRADRTAVADAAEQLDAYFAGDLRRFDLTLRPAGTSFQQAVVAPGQIPYGEVVAYGEIARRMGRPGSSRAVGTANGRNPLAVVVPCHRVIGANGSLTGYGGGLWRKEWLLAHEGIGLPSCP